MNLFQICWMGIACLALSVIEALTNGLQFSAATVLLGGASGIFNVFSGMSLLMAMTTGPLSITILIFSMYVVVPPILAIPILHEQNTFCQGIGILMIIAVLVTGNYSKPADSAPRTKKWWLYCVSSALFSGLASFLIKVQQMLLPGLEQREYSISNFAAGVITAGIFYLWFSRRDAAEGKARYKPTAALFLVPAIALAICQSGAQMCNLYNATRLPAIVLYPVTQLSTLMLTTVYSIVFLHERPTPRNIACLTMGGTAILLMNF